MFNVQEKTRTRVQIKDIKQKNKNLFLKYKPKYLRCGLQKKN